MGSNGVARRPDTRLEDPQALAEIELYGELVIAASSSEDMLSQQQIDQALGLESPTRPAVRPAG